MKVKTLAQDFTQLTVAFYPFDHNLNVSIQVSRSKNLGTGEWGPAIISWDRCSTDDISNFHQYIDAMNRAAAYANMMDANFSFAWKMAKEETNT